MVRSLGAEGKKKKQQLGIIREVNSNVGHIVGSESGLSFLLLNSQPELSENLHIMMMMIENFSLRK